MLHCTPRALSSTSSSAAPNSYAKEKSPLSLDHRLQPADIFLQLLLRRGSNHRLHDLRKPSLIVRDGAIFQARLAVLLGKHVTNLIAERIRINVRRQQF